MHVNRRVVLLVAGLLVFLGSVPGRATQNATVTGLVFDEKTGAPVAEARVLLSSTNTSTKRETTTGADGSYTFNEVPPSDDYILDVRREGYERYVRPTLVEVAVADIKQVQPPVPLKPLPAPAPPPPKREEVQPPQPPPPTPNPSNPAPPAPTPPPPPPPPPPAPTKSEGVSVNAVNNTLGGVIDSRALRTLPLADRDFLDLALLTPGTYPVEQGSALEGASLVVNGVRANMNNFLLDGADDNDYTINQSLPFQLVEAMQEFRVQASTSTAEYGRSGGAQINSVSRRGLSTVHGGFFEFLRSSRLSPDNFFSAYRGGGFDQVALNFRLEGIGDPLGDPTLSRIYNRRKPQVIQNQFGANVGGAMKQDKLFGFFNWESFRASNPRPIFEGVPEQCVRSNALFTKCPEVQFLNAFLTSLGGSPVTQADPVALKLFNLYPAPNVPRTDFTDPSLGPAFFAGESANRTSTDNFLERVDWRKSDRASVSFKHNIQRIDQVQGGTIPRTANYPGNGTNVNGRNQSFTVNYSQQYTHTGNELRLAWNRLRLGALAQDRSVDPASLGFQNLTFHNRGLPSVFVGGLFSLFSLPYATLGADFAVPSNRADNVWSVGDTLDYLRGSHNWKFGGGYRYIRLDVRNEALGRGVLSLSDGPDAAFFGSPDFVSIGRVTPDFGGGFDRSLRSRFFDWFVQDQWRRSNLSINFGLRYEMNTAPVEARDRLVNYYPALGGLVRSGSKTVLDPFGKTISTASNGVPRAGFETAKNNFGPHFGFAWSPRSSRKTVVRGAYAVVFDQQPMEPSANMVGNPPFVMRDVSRANFGASLDTAFQFQQQPGLSSKTGWFRLPYSITARDPNTRTSYVHQFNFGIQEQLGAKGLLEVAYIGSAGHKLPRLRDISPCTQLLRSQPALDARTCFNNINTQPFFFTTILDQENSANSNFNSLLVRLQTRSFRGLQLDAHYQLAKSIDGASSLQPQLFQESPAVASLFVSLEGINPDPFAGVNNVSPTLSVRPTLPIITDRPRLPQDSGNLRGERGRSDFDVHHRLVLDFIYEVPGWKRLRGLGKGWDLAGIATVQSGQPYSVFTDYFGFPLRPNLKRQPSLNNHDPNAAIENPPPVIVVDPKTELFTFNFPSGSPFSLAPNFNLKPGNLGRNTFTGPKLMNADFSILKNNYFGVGERKNLQFRVEFFNVFNTTNFFEPDGKAGLVFTDFTPTLFKPPLPPAGSFLPNPFFGRILQARPATQVQFAIRFSF